LALLVTLHDFYIHQSQNASIITAKDRKTLSPAESRLHWMQMISDKPILPVVTASVSTTTNATPVPSATQADTLPLGFESSMAWKSFDNPFLQV
jgi:hypothetical protein